MSINLITGCMFSGKTSALIKIANNCKKDNLKVIIINYIGDTRYSKSDKITTHDGISMDCKTCGKDLIDILIKSSVLTADVICINEGQFFEDLYDIINILVNMHKKRVYVCGLDGDFKRRKFGKILDIIPLSDNVRKLKAICKKCKKREAIFTHRLNSKSNNQVVIGDCDTYTSLCRCCYNLMNAISPTGTTQ